MEIYSSIGSSPFILRLFPDSTGWSDWVIIFGLPGARTREEALAFLSGTHPDKRLKLGEFAIRYPICGSRESPATEVSVVERFTGERVGLKLPIH